MDYLSNGKLIHLRINGLGDAWPLRRSCFAQTALPLAPKPQLLSTTTFEPSPCFIQSKTEIRDPEALNTTIYIIQ